MPTAGLSLVGFMDQPQALHHFRSACVPPSNDDAVLIAEHGKAAAKLGAAMAKFGQPEIKDILPQHAAYVGTLSQLPWVAETLAQSKNPAFKMVEIDPLLAYQFTVDNDRSQHHCGALSGPPTDAELLNICLPHTQPTEQYSVSLNQNSVLIKSRSLNLRTGINGLLTLPPPFNLQVLGAQIFVSLTLSHVVKFNGRYYLHNGFHRAIGIRAKGATHMPCLVRDVDTAQEANILGNGATFPLTLMESNNPPTVGHFTQGRAYDVALRATSKIIQVNWTEHVVPEE